MFVAAMVVAMATFSSADDWNPVKIFPGTMEEFDGEILRWPHGQPLLLTCKVFAPGDYKFEWFLPHAESRAANTNFMNETVSVIHFDEMTDLDSGTYECKVSSGKTGQSFAADVGISVNAGANKGGECGRDFFRCNASLYCIQRRFICDGVVDCKDGSDEDARICGDDPCAGKWRCYEEHGRCMDTEICCDPNESKNCTVVTQCCQTYLTTKRLLQSRHPGRNVVQFQATIYTIIGSFCLVSLMAMILAFFMCRVHQKYSGSCWHNLTGRRLPAGDEMVDCDSPEIGGVFSTPPPPYNAMHAIYHDPPPPYEAALLEAMANNNGDINGNSDLVDRQRHFVQQPRAFNRLADGDDTSTSSD